MTAKNRFFWKVRVTKDGKVEAGCAEKGVEGKLRPLHQDHVFAAQEAVFGKEEGVVGLKAGFEKIESWVKNYFGQ